MTQPIALTSDKIDKYAKQSPRVKRLMEALKSPLHSFVPRPNIPEEYDEQSAFIDSKSKCCILLGGTGCVAGETEIYDPVARKFRRVGKINGPWHVLSEQNGCITAASAAVPHLKGTADLYCVTLSNGQKFVATLQHRILVRSVLPQFSYESLAEILPIFDNFDVMCFPGKIANGKPDSVVSITSIEFLRKDTFYDFTVPVTHNYLLAGIFHHNSGKTIAAAVKTARYVLEVPPPRPYCPFWIIGETYDMVCQVCWLEKLSTLIPKVTILDIDWYKEKRQWPFAVILGDPRDITKPGWVLEFKSYAQGRQRMQAASVGGYWCNEEIPLEILQEVQGRTRDYDSPGWCDFTPVELRTPDWIDIYDETPEGWKFFHLNVELNDALPEGWAQRYLETIPEDMRETRRIGTFTQFSGSVYKEWNQNVHLVNVGNPTEKQQHDLPWLDPFAPDFGIPELWSRFRGIDWGYNNPLACLWVAKDGDGRYYIYDEHFESQKLLQYHVAKIKERHWNEKFKVVYKQTFADPAGALERAEFSRLGIPTSAAYNDLDAGIEIVRKHLMIQGDGRPKLYLLSIRENARWVRCKNLIREIRTYHWPPGIGTGLTERNPKDVPVDKDNHALDAMRYVVATDSRGETMSVKKIHKRIRPWQEECRSRFLLN